MTKVKSRFPILLAAHREKISDVSRATGISRTTLTNLYYSKGEALSYNVLGKLCEHFSCTANDLFELCQEGGDQA